MGFVRLRRWIGCVAFVVLAALATGQPVPFWTSTTEDPIYPAGAASAVDSAGNVYVATGGSLPNDFAPGYMRLTKYGPTGSLVWQKSGPEDKQGLGAGISNVIVCPDGNVLVVGWFRGESRETMTLQKFSPAGTFLWGTNAWEVAPVVVDTDGSIFVALRGTLHGNFGGVLKLSAAGATLWETHVGDDFNQWSTVNDLVPDGAGGVWVTGGYGPADGGTSTFYLQRITGVANQVFPSASNEPVEGSRMIPSGDGNFLIYRKSDLAKVTPQQAVLWSAPTPSLTSAAVLRRDPSGNVFLSGTIPPSTFPQAYVGKFSSAGVLLWDKKIQLASFDGARDLQLDPSGNAFLLGVQRQSDLSPDGFLIKYLPNGGLGWPALTGGALRVGTPDFEYLSNLVRDSAGNFFIGFTEASISGSGGGYVGAQKLGAANNASFVTQNVPTSMAAGQSYSVSVTMSNTGVASWSLADGYYLRSQNPVDNSLWGKKRIDLSNSETILRDQAKKFSFTVYAPMDAGSYKFQWRMSQGTSVFGSSSPLLTIPVSVKQHAARYVSQVVPTSVKAGSTFTVKVTMRNVGANTWSQAGGYTLRPAPGFPTWNVTSVGLLSTDSIPRGGDKTFTITCQAPATPGAYTMRWRMHRQASAFTGFFGDLTTSKTITVTP